MPKIKIIKVDYGIASNYGNLIEINRKLRGNLKKRILKHEFRHLKGKYGIKDYRNDFNSSNPYFIESIKFALRNPEAFINFFPFMYSYYLKKWTFNISSFIFFGFYSIIFCLITSILLKVMIIYSFLFFLYVMAFLNVFFLIYTHFYMLRMIKTNKKVSILGKGSFRRKTRTFIF